MPSLSPHLFMTLSSTVILDYFLFVAVVLSSLCVEGAGAAPVSLPWVAGEGLVRRATGGGSSTTSGMNRQVAHGLSFALIIAAVLIGLVVLARRSQTWHRQRHGSPPRIPPFLRDRPSSGSIPVIMSPRTAAIVAKDPSAYGAPPSDHAMPHWTGHFHSMEPLTPPPPAYSAATSPVNNDKALQRV